MATRSNKVPKAHMRELTHITSWRGQGDGEEWVLESLKEEGRYSGEGCDARIMSIKININSILNSFNQIKTI